VALADALEALRQKWPEIHGDLDPSELRTINQQLAAAVHGARWDPDLLLRTALAHQPDDHEVWVALARTAVRRDQSTARTRPLVAAANLRLQIESDAVEDIPGDADDVERAAEQRVWTVPMAEVGDDALRPHLLVLSRATKRFAPRFQFDADGTVLETVAAVNEILDVEDDPWGAASWWLTPHASLHAIPADEIRIGSPANVLAAAHALDALP
jgi:hypothetical protein